jgi:hypothetical protein
MVKVDLHTGLPVDPAAPVGGKTIDEAFVVDAPAATSENPIGLEGDGTQIDPKPEDGNAEFFNPDAGVEHKNFLQQPEPEVPNPQTGGGGLY